MDGKLLGKIRFLLWLLEQYIWKLGKDIKGYDWFTNIL